MRVQIILGDKQLMWNCPQQSKLLSLQHFISSRFNINDFMFSWKDEEDDNITILTEEDIDMVLNIVTQDNRNIITFYVMPKLSLTGPSTYIKQLFHEYDEYIEIINLQKQTAPTGESTPSISSEENNTNQPLLSILTSSLNDALSDNAETTLTSVITAEKLVDTQYFTTLFTAIQSVFANVMVDKLGHEIIKPLFIHCDQKQKSILIRNISHNIIQISCQQSGYLSILAIMDTLAHSKEFVNALIANIKELATVEYGVRSIIAYFQTMLVEGVDVVEVRILLNVVFAIIQHTDMLIQNQFGWFIFYFLLRDAPITITDPIKAKIQSTYGTYCKHEFAVKVVEQCLHHSFNEQLDNEMNTKTDWATIIVQEILSKSDDLVDDKCGKHVFHLALLTKVKGNDGDHLAALKHAATAVYVKHVRQIRMRCRSTYYEYGQDSDDDDDEEIYAANVRVYDNEMENEILEYMDYPVFT